MNEALVVQAPAPVERAETGIAALGAMSATEFTARLQTLKQGMERMQLIIKSILVEGRDYETLPGMDRPMLLEQGSQTLAGFFGLVPLVKRKDLAWGDGKTTPHLRVEVDVEVHHGAGDGPVVGDGSGSCNSWEVKYRYRNAERLCPDCGKGAIIKGDPKYTPDKKPNWVCWKKRDGCGKSFPENDQRITGQTVGRVEIDDPADLEHTLTLMAIKRAKVHAIRQATRTSGIFSQDEDIASVQAAVAAQAAREAQAAANAGKADSKPAQATGAPQAPQARPAGPVNDLTKAAPNHEEPLIKAAYDGALRLCLLTCGTGVIDGFEPKSVEEWNHLWTTHIQPMTTTPKGIKAADWGHLTAKGPKWAEVACGKMSDEAKRLEIEHADHIADGEPPA